MAVRPSLICFFFLAVQDGNSGLAKAQIPFFTRTQGQAITVTCTFTLSGSRLVFCKNECRGEGEILIETSNITAQSGRYRIEYKELRLETNVLVSISQLTSSDSGRYWCGLVRHTTLFHSDFRLIVVDALLTGSPPEGTTFNKTSGDNIVVACVFSFSGRRTYFCKDQCEDKNLLVETTRPSTQRDRYGIEYVRGSPSGGNVYVSISQLTRSDSGLYKCGLDTHLSLDHYHEFRIVVADGEIHAWTTTGPITTLPGTETPTPRAAGALLYGGLALLVLVLVSLPVLIFCRRRMSKAIAVTMETKHAVSETHHVYEDFREDGQRRCPPVEMSSVHSTPKSSKPSGAETNVDYSLNTAANLHNTAEDDSSRLTYSTVHFPKGAADSVYRALSRDADQVVYSVPQVRERPDADRPGDDPPCLFLGLETALMLTGLERTHPVCSSG
ncbi:uncharacterized protein LOC117941021 [Etheostoma cragini]|uniref:uncharacterized protein LOC117941021 n=1 Tax=Etheostoma cragini TaxID=417921 RepID=UPI00155EB524|nr:uncharacterized protein LOC117941021 [Etheostoma cragini]